MTVTIPDAQDLLIAAQSCRNDAVKMLTELVQHPSLLGQEASAQAYMAKVFTDLGLQVHEFEINHDKIRHHPGYSPSILSYDGRRNVVATHTPTGPSHGRSLILNGHIDVVPVGCETLWHTPPFTARVEGDRVYGRGSNDMKAGIVCYTMAMRLLKELGWEPAATVIFQSVIEEECTGNGALSCLVEGYVADAALIPEPTEETVVSAQIGVMWLRIEVFGVPVHASRAHAGVSALEFMQYLIKALQTLEKKWNESDQRHPAYCEHTHPINFNVGRLEGGEWPSSVATHANADIRIGYYPDKTASQVKAEVESLLHAAHARHALASSIRYRVVYQGFQADGFELDMTQPLIETLNQCHAAVHGKTPHALALTATTDARIFNLYGDIPATCYGPSGGSQHGIDEWVSIDSMTRVTAVYALFIAQWCGLNPIQTSA